MNGGNGLGGIGRVGSERYPATSTVGYSYFIATSTWGICPNAFGGKYSLKFCDGVVNLGVVGHEYTHAVSDFIGPPTTSLAYKNESGAIEEAIADIMSQGVERHANGAYGVYFVSWRRIKYLQSGRHWTRGGGANIFRSA